MHPVDLVDLADQADQVDQEDQLYSLQDPVDQEGLACRLRPLDQVPQVVQVAQWVHKSAARRLT